MSDFPELSEYQICYRTKSGLVLFREEFTLESLNEVRNFLDILTDVLILKQLNNQENTMNYFQILGANNAQN